MNAKLAHLFLVRDNLNHESLWKRFFRGHKGLYEIYVHAKWPIQITSDWWRQRLISDTCETRWGSISLVQAELLLLKAALRDSNNQFFLLHSESCAPIRTFECVYREIVTTNRSWINYHRGNMDRYYGINQASIRRDHFYKCSQFFCLTRAHAEVVLKQLDLNDWSGSWCADEHCVPTTLSKHGRLYECNQCNLTYSYAPRPSRSPVTFHDLSAEALDALKRTSSLFARKFASDSNIGKYFPLDQMRRATRPQGCVVRHKAAVDLFFGQQARRVSFKQFFSESAE